MQSKEQVSKQTNKYFSVSDGQKRLFHSDTYFVQYIHQTAHFCAWSAHHIPMLWENGKRCQKIQKSEEKNKTSMFSLELDTIWTLQILKILCRNATISHLIIKVDRKYWSYISVTNPINKFLTFFPFLQSKLLHMCNYACIRVSLCKAGILAVLFPFFKSRTPCDQTWWDSPNFLIGSCLLYVVDAKNTLVGSVEPF